jgi:hypothetical protein
VEKHIEEHLLKWMTMEIGPKRRENRRGKGNEIHPRAE